MCIDIVEIWFGTANGQILEELSARDTSIFSFLDDNLSKYQGILTKLDTCIDIKVCFGIANRQISSFFDSYLPQHDNRIIVLRFLFCLENSIWHFVQGVSKGYNLHEVSDPIF